MTAPVVLLRLPLDARALKRFWGPALLSRSCYKQAFVFRLGLQPCRLYEAYRDPVTV